MICVLIISISARLRAIRRRDVVLSFFPALLVLPAWSAGTPPETRELPGVTPLARSIVDFDSAVSIVGTSCRLWPGGAGSGV